MAGLEHETRALSGSENTYLFSDCWMNLPWPPVDRCLALIDEMGALIAGYTGRGRAYECSWLYGICVESVSGLEE